MKRASIIVALTGAMLFAAPSQWAMAHVCFVANDGAATTGNSQRWFTFSIEFALSDFFGLSGEDLAEAVELAEERGLPTSFKTRTDRTLLENAADEALGKTGDGKGIEWFTESPIVDQLIDIVLTVTA